MHVHTLTVCVCSSTIHAIPRLCLWWIVNHLHVRTCMQAPMPAAAWTGVIEDARSRPNINDNMKADKMRAMHDKFKGSKIEMAAPVHLVASGFLVQGYV